MFDMDTGSPGIPELDVLTHLLAPGVTEQLEPWTVASFGITMTGKVMNLPSSYWVPNVHTD